MDLKTFIVETFEIAEWNVLKAIFRLKPKDLEIQTTPNRNPIRWIIGHLILQMDTFFNYLCDGKRKFSAEFRDYFSTGLEREKEMTFPVSYKILIDTFLQYSKTGLTHLYDLREEKFNELPVKNDKIYTETVSEWIQRISLHFLGHVGQIYIIKREIGKGGYFVAGVKKKGRDESRMKWLNWWNKNKEKYQ